MKARMRNNNALVDTNVLVYAIDEDSQFYERSHQFLFNPNYRLYNSAKNLVEFLTVVTRNPAISLSTEDALSSVKDYEGVLKILYPSKTTFAKFKELLEKYKLTGLKIHDYEIASISLANKIEQIATFNVKDFEGITEIKLIKL